MIKFQDTILYLDAYNLIYRAYFSSKFGGFFSGGWVFEIIYAHAGWVVVEKLPTAAFF